MPYPFCLIFMVAIAFSFDPGFAQQKPNILIIITDDQGYGDLGIHGNDIVRTPNIDAFARESTEFTQFIVNPSCTPTRASLMTGRDSYRAGVTDV